MLRSVAWSTTPKFSLDSWLDPKAAPDLRNARNSATSTAPRAPICSRHSMASLPSAAPEDRSAAREDAQRCLERTLELRSELEFLLESASSDFVFWIERRGRGVFLQATPVDVSTLMEEHLFRDTDTVVMTSATLSVGGSMEFVRRRLGLRYARDY